mmetsp:Transcript_11176/g.30051  ORF Transcript_11176/g.30051 Transcript_11176/m.30051 type:complete len:200 (+) Transcript_11176:643-1242(+)
MVSPLCRNWRATSTPPGKYPPGLFRRSITNLFAPAVCISFSAAATSAAVLEVNCRMSTRPMSSPSLGRFTTRCLTEAIFSDSRVMSILRSPELFRTLIETLVPGTPRMRAAASSGDSDSTDSPSMSVITSPLRTPARSAGLPSIGLRILSSPSTRAGYICTPTPASSPVAEDVSELSCAGDRNLVYGSSRSLSILRMTS